MLFIQREHIYMFSLSLYYVLYSCKMQHYKPLCKWVSKLVWSFKPYNLGGCRQQPARLCWILLHTHKIWLSFLLSLSLSLYLYIYTRANGIYIFISQKVAICSLWTVCPCFSLVCLFVRCRKAFYNYGLIRGIYIR